MTGSATETRQIKCMLQQQQQQQYTSCTVMAGTTHTHTYTTINGYRCMQMLSQQTRKSVRMHTHVHERTLTNTRTHYTKHTRNMNRVQRRTSANRHSGGSRTTSTTHLVCVCVCVLHRCVHLHANVRMCGNASHAAARNQYIHKILYAVPLPA